MYISHFRLPCGWLGLCYWYSIMGLCWTFFVKLLCAYYAKFWSRSSIQTPPPSLPLSLYRQPLSVSFLSLLHDIHWVLFNAGSHFLIVQLLVELIGFHFLQMSEIIRRDCGLGVLEASKFFRVSVNKAVYYSQEYTRITARNSYTICYTNQRTIWFNLLFLESVS